MVPEIAWGGYIAPSHAMDPFCEPMLSRVKLKFIHFYAIQYLAKNSGMGVDYEFSEGIKGDRPSLKILFCEGLHSMSPV